MNVMGLAKVTTQGQITIPKVVRDRLKLKEGDYVIFYLTEDKPPKLVIAKGGE